jgi:hypothetical protein
LIFFIRKYTCLSSVLCMSKMFHLLN